MSDFVDKILWAKEVLGVSDSLSIKDLKRVYRYLSKQHHPDVSGSGESQRELNKAYKILLEYLENYRVPLGENDIKLPPEEKMRSFYYGDWIGGKKGGKKSE